MNTKQILKSLLAAVVILLSGCEETTKFYANTLRSDKFIQTYDENRYDFLWVMDNSGSMATRRAFVRDNLQSFLDTLNSRKAIDYQMAITTTDMFTDQGKLVQSPAGLKVVKSTSTNPVGDFAAIMNNIQDSPTSFWEQGLESSYQAVYLHGSDFSRAGVPLIIVYLTDSDDWSCKSNCYGVEPEHNSNYVRYDVNRYITYFQNYKLAENTDVAVFPIMGLPDNACPVEQDSVTGNNFIGYRYMQLNAALANFGKDASICNHVLQESYQGIARTIADRANKFKLANPSDGTGINVFVNGVLIPFSPDNYIFEKETNSIIFTGAAPKKDAIIEVAYAQQSN